MEEKVQIFIPDASYDNDLVSANEFKQKLLDQIKSIEADGSKIKTRPLLKANIGAGADWPAFLAEIIPAITPYAPLALFFMGKKINENIDAWISIGGKLYSLMQLTGGWLNRGAALVVSLFKIKEEIGDIHSIEIIQYEAIDGRFLDNWENTNPERRSAISEDLADEYRGGQIHYFRIIVNDTEVEALIYGAEYRIRENKK